MPTEQSEHAEKAEAEVERLRDLLALCTHAEISLSETANAKPSESALEPPQ